MQFRRVATTPSPITGEDCRQLWCAVLHHAITDALAPRPRTPRADHEQARRYIGSRDFREVCWLAGLDPEAVEHRLRERMAAAAA